MGFFQILLLLFLLVPVIEIYLLIEVGSMIGAIYTILLVVLTAVVGAALLRWQGFTTFQRVREAMARGEVPAIEMMEGVVLLLCGALLLTPGFFTDAIGFLALIPAVRRHFILEVIKRQSVSMSGGFSQQNTYEGKGQNHESRTIEGESWKDNDEKRR
ncbi:MAG: FxsA family protein [Gammaproteobacteria bacterium]|nr:FxsA family protein [Gammaproteobacteria bacterium]